MSEPRDFELIGSEGTFLQGAETLPQAVHLMVSLEEERGIPMDDITIQERGENERYRVMSEERIEPFLRDELRAHIGGVDA